MPAKRRRPGSRITEPATRRPLPGWPADRAAASGGKTDAPNQRRKGALGRRSCMYARGGSARLVVLAKRRLGARRRRYRRRGKPRVGADPVRGPVYSDAIDPAHRDAHVHACDPGHGNASARDGNAGAANIYPRSSRRRGGCDRPAVHGQRQRRRYADRAIPGTGNRYRPGAGGRRRAAAAQTLVAGRGGSRVVLPGRTPRRASGEPEKEEACSDPDSWPSS